MLITVRFAQETDVKAICSIGQSDTVFAISKQIVFYRETEIIEWANSPEDNIFLIVEDEKNICGFLFCKKMSHHWAMLDSFYILPEARKSNAALLLWEKLSEELLCRKVPYLSALIDSEKSSLRRLLKSYGFTEARNYMWMEKFIFPEGESTC